MKYYTSSLVFLVLITGCGTLQPVVPGTLQQQTTERDTMPNFGYQPLDPLSVKFILDTTQDKTTPYNIRLLNSLPDETMRLAIAQIDGNTNIGFGPAKVGYKGHSYIVILDYIKSQTYPFPIRIPRNQPNPSDSTEFYASSSDSADAYIPVYVGVGLRLTASVTVDSGYVDLGNLFSIAAAAEARRLSGTMVIQTLGISGEGISSALPIPSQLNTTTIQNALVAIGSIKSKMYDNTTRVSPRIVGFYNNVGDGKNSINYFIATFLNHKANLIHSIK